jgi:hypothetical protein
LLEYLLRFIAGGIAVSAFAAFGDALRPKSFAGLFGAAPSIALATILITLSQKGGPFAAVEGRSMIAGAFALAAYTSALRETRWYEYLIRFALGGVVTVVRRRHG